MEGKSTKEISHIAVASVCCTIAAIISVLFFGLFKSGYLVLLCMFFSTAAFVLGITALVVITVRRKLLKGYTYAITAILYGSIFGCLIFVVWMHARHVTEREKANTGLYNLKVLGRALVEYANDHDGYLPAADRWCDLLMEHSNGLTRDNFRHPRSQDLNLEGVCHFAFNKYLGGERLADIPGDVVLVFEADGDWNLTGAGELLKNRRTTVVDEYYIDMFFVDKTVRSFWFNRQAVKRFDSGDMVYEPPQWSP